MTPTAPKVTLAVHRSSIEQALRAAEAANDCRAIAAAKRLLSLIDRAPDDYLAVS